MIYSYSLTGLCRKTEPFNLPTNKSYNISMNIIEIFKSGSTLQFGNKTPKHIITVVSNVFVFDKKAYKIYKNDSKFFNENFHDLSDKAERFKFTRTDFEWNNRLSPEVYTELKGVVLKDNNISFTAPTDDADELVIVMNTIDTANQLINRLVDNSITLTDCYEMGKQLAVRVSKLPKLKALSTAYEDFLMRHSDIKPWIGGVEKHIPKELASKYQDYIKDFIESHKDELNSTDLMGTCVDIHADNAIYDNGKFLPIDVYAPKEQWLHGYKFINLYRVATDILGFLGKEGFNRVIEGYEKASEEIVPRQYDKFLIIYCELINWPYQYMLSEKETWRLDVAKKYGNVIETAYNNKEF